MFRAERFAIMRELTCKFRTDRTHVFL